MLHSAMLTTANTSSLVVPTYPKLYSIEYSLWSNTWQEKKIPLQVHMAEERKTSILDGFSFFIFFFFSSFFEKLEVHLSFYHVPQDGNRR